MLEAMAHEAARVREVFHVDINSTNEPRDEAQEILETLEQIQTDPQLRAEASNDPERVLNRFRLSGVARHAVALGIASMLVVPVAHPTVFWQ
jgi:hypothetical protein